jgi:hypothetical protein
MELEAAKVAEQTAAEAEAEAEAEAAAVAEDEAEDEPVEEPRRRHQGDDAFHEIASAMARFENMDPNSSRFLKVNRGIDDTLACYREEEKKKATVQSSLGKFVRKAERSRLPHLHSLAPPPLPLHPCQPMTTP